MIKPAEIQKKARDAGVRDTQIEKDYVLSWILNGIANHNHLSKILVFKGGTVLRKVYFKKYRFSEDLDFTLIKSNVDSDQIFTWFHEVFNYIRDEANIPLEITDKNQHEDGGIYFYLDYIGPFGGARGKRKIKVDISRNEKLEFAPVFRPAFLEYSDLKKHQLLCYPPEELLVEKLRSVMQRMQARDFYDLWYLLEVNKMDICLYLNEFNNKCASKGLSSSGFSKRLQERLPQYRGRWKSSMSEQIHNLPDFEKVERETLRHLKKLK
jgi:predicted nucleotidyltransferase component of viral defense system